MPLGINYGLSAIKNVGETSIFELLKERNKNGEFKNILDLLKRVNNSILNKKILEALVFPIPCFHLKKIRIIYRIILKNCLVLMLITIKTSSRIRRIFF